MLKKTLKANGYFVLQLGAHHKKKEAREKKGYHSREDGYKCCCE
jgi:hypothetical protein